MWQTLFDLLYSRNSKIDHNTNPLLLNIRILNNIQFFKSGLAMKIKCSNHSVRILKLYYYNYILYFKISKIMQCIHWIQIFKIYLFFLFIIW